LRAGTRFIQIYIYIYINLQTYPSLKSIERITDVDALWAYCNI
jgi:hypothetical protein